MSCARGEMVLSPHMHRVLTEWVASSDRRTEIPGSYSGRFGERWFCPGCGVEMHSQAGFVSCPQCGGQIANGILKELLDLNPHRRLPR
jgi:hypothetical protein